MVGHMGREASSPCRIHLSETERGETGILIPLQSTCQWPNFLIAGPISQRIYHFLEVSQTGNQAFGMWVLKGYLKTKPWYESITEDKENLLMDKKNKGISCGWQMCCMTSLCSPEPMFLGCKTFKYFSKQIFLKLPVCQRIGIKNAELPGGGGAYL